VLKKSGIRADATIINVKRVIMRSEDDPPTFYFFVFYAYETAFDKITQKYEVGKDMFDRLSIGDVFPLLYDVDQPKKNLPQLSKRKRNKRWKTWKPPERIKYTRLTRKEMIISILFGFGIVILLSLIKPLVSTMVSETSSLYPLIQEMGGCILWAGFLWSLFVYLAVWGWKTTSKQDQRIDRYKENIPGYVYFEPKIQENLAACIHCKRHLMPGTAFCPYCENHTNLGKRRMFVSGLGILYAIMGLLFESILANRPSLDTFILLFVLLGVSGTFFWMGWRENRFWKSLSSFTN
jgi:hypothetical protein